MPSPDCHIVETGSSDYFETLARRIQAEGHFPLAGSLELTLRCNLACPHCYARCPTLQDSELSTANVCRGLDKLKECGVLMLTLTGGEPLLRPDFARIYTHAKKCGFLVTLLTNATLIDASRVKLFAQWPPRRVEVTIYGATPAVYESISGVPGSFSQFERGISLLRQFKVPMSLKMMVLRQNITSFADIQRYVEALQVPFRYDSIVNPRLDGDCGPLQNRISPEETAALFQQAAKQHPLPNTPPMPAKIKNPARLFRCGAGLKTFHVDPKGNMHPCLMWRQHPFDLLKRNPTTEWESHIQFIKKEERPSTSLCNNCRHLSACMNCPAFSRLETGTAGGEVDYFCRVMNFRSPADSGRVKNH